ncbi:BrxA family protein [Rubripirellula lacrimiformis]|nr:BrxA family protein [Rubripirellula lacrimiformis]
MMSSVMAKTVSDPYTIRISKGAALLPETRMLLREWKVDEDAASLAERVLEADLLGKATARRVRDIVQRCFAPRLLSPAGCPARHMKRLVENRSSNDWFRDLCLLYSARADRLLRDSITVFLTDAINEGRLSVTVDTATAFLCEAEEKGMMESPWAAETKKKVSRGVLKALAEFGLLSTNSRKPREILSFRPHPIAVAYLAYDLHFSGKSDAGVASHQDWSIWQCNKAVVRESLDELSRHGLWVFQAAGNVVRITWNASTMEEAVDVLVGINI